MKFLRDLFTGVDNSTYDLGRILLALGCLTMIAGACRVIWMGALDFVAFGGGFGGLLTGGGALLLMKRQTEPQTKLTATSDDGSATLEVKS